MRTGIIYKYTNKIHKGFSYIGQTLFDRSKREGLDCKRYSKCIVFSKAIQKYGIENFEYEVIEDNVPEDKLDEREIYWIQYYHTYVGDPCCCGYNMTTGGQTNRGRVCREETKKKTSKTLQGHSVTEKVRERMKELNKKRKGQKPKNFEDALILAHQATSKRIVEIKTRKEYESKAACAAAYGKSIAWVNARLKGHIKCKEEIFAEATSSD